MSQTLYDQYEKLKDEYKNFTKNIEDRILIDNRVLQECLSDQLQLEIEVGRLLNKAKYYKEECQIEADRVYSNKFSDIATDSYKDFSSTEAKQIAMSDESYIDYRKLLNRFQKIFNELDELADVIETRKYTLKTLSDSMINSVNKTVI